MEVAEKKWYVIRVVTGQEVKIKDYIMYEVSRVSLDKQIDEMLVPTEKVIQIRKGCLLYTSPSPRDGLLSRMPSSA